jgi:hypothetical protein
MPTQAWLRDRQPSGDEAETIDRLFLLRYMDRLLYVPRRPAIAAALGPDDGDGTWYLIWADLPFDPFSHQRQLLAGIPGPAAAGDCAGVEGQDHVHRAQDALNGDGYREAA